MSRAEIAAREARTRAEQLGRAFGATARPTRRLREQLESARREADRLSDSLDKQRRDLGEHQTAMRRAGDSVEDFARIQERLTAARAEHDHLGGLLAQRNEARQDRHQARGDVLGAVGVAYAVARPLMGAVGAATRFESAMADVRKVVDFPTPEAFQAMGKSVREMSTRIPVAAEGLAAIMAAAGQANVPRAELQGFTEDAAKVAVAFDLSGEQAGSAMAGLRSIFGLGQQGAMDLAGALNHLSNNMDATAPGLLDIANRAGSMGRLFGLTGQQIGALGATFLQLKTPPEVAATGTNAMLQRLQTADQQTSKFQAALARIGLSAEGMRDHIARDAQGALLGFLEAVEGADDKAGILFQLFGQEYADDIQKLVGGLDHYRRALGLASAENANAASIIAEYEQRAKTTEHALTLFQNRTNQMAAAVGSALLPPLNATLETLGPMVSWVAATAETFAGATRVIVGTTAAVVGFNVLVKTARFLTASYREAIVTLKIAKAWLARQTWVLTAMTRLYTRATRAAAGAVAGVGRALVSTAAGQWVAVRAMRAWQAVTKAVTIAQGVLNAVLWANPVVAIIAGVVALGAALYAVVKYWDEILGWINTAATAVGRFFGLIDDGPESDAPAGEGAASAAGRTASALEFAMPEGLAAPDAAGFAAPAPVTRNVTVRYDRPELVFNISGNADVDTIRAVVDEALERLHRDAQRAADRAQDDG